MACPYVNRRFEERRFPKRERCNKVFHGSGSKSRMEGRGEAAILITANSCKRSRTLDEDKR